MEVVALVEVAAPEGGSLEALHMDHRSNNQGVVVGERIPGTLLEVHNSRTDKDCIQGEASADTVGWGTVEELRKTEPWEALQGWQPGVLMLQGPSVLEAAVAGWTEAAVDQEVLAHLK